MLQDHYFYQELGERQSHIMRLKSTVQEIERDFNCLSDAYGDIKRLEIPPLETTNYNQTILELNAMYQKILRSIYNLKKRLELFEKAAQNDYHAYAMLLQDQGMELDYVIQLGRSRISELQNRYRIEYNGIERQIRNFNYYATKLNNQFDANSNPRKAAIKRILNLKTLYDAIDKKCEDINSVYESETQELDEVSSSLSRSISSLHSSINKTRSQIPMNPNDRYCVCGVCTTNLSHCPSCGRKQV